ncbi:unnamed protein product, partial [Laminaria digitata]
LLQVVDRLSAQLAGRLNFEYQDPQKNFDRSKVKGLVARLVDVKDKAHSTALEVAAGGRLYQARRSQGCIMRYGVVVDTEQTSKLLVQKGKLRRRVTFVPVNKITGNPLKPNQLSRAAAIAQRMNGHATCAIELVGYDNELRGVMSYVFGSSIVCDSLDIAKQVAFDKGVRARTVTLGGDAFEPQGTLTGGSAAQLGVVLTRLAELQAASRDLGAHEERLRGVVDKIGRFSVASKKFSELSNEVELRRHELGLLVDRLGQSSHSQLENKLAETMKGLEEEGQAVEAAKAAGAAAAAKNEQLKKEEASFRQAREQLLEDLERRVKAAKALLVTATAALKKEQRLSQVLEMELAQLHEAGASQTEVRAVAEEGLEAAEKKVERLEGVVREQKALFEEANGTLEELKREQAEHDSALKGLRKDKEKATKTLRTAELELKTLTSKLKQYLDGRNHAERAVSNMLEKFPWIKEDRPFFGRPQTDYDFEARDPATAQKRLKALQEEQASLSKKVMRAVIVVQVALFMR